MKKEERGNVILCTQCSKEERYIIPLYIINKKSNKIGYRCYKHNKLNEDNIYDCTLTNNLKRKLNICQIHEKQFCAWCNKCEKNLCQICLGNEFKKNHDYILINSLLTKNDEKKIINNNIEELKMFLKEIRKYYGDIKNYKNDIINLENIIKCNEISYNLYFKEEISNYQSIINLKKNRDYSKENYEKYKSLYEQKYNVFLSFIKGKPFNDINQIKIPIEKINKTIFILNSESDNENVYKNVIIVLYIEIKVLLIFDMNGKIINTFKLENLSIGQNCQIIQYESNILMLFYKTFISFIIFDDDFQNYEITKEIDLSEKIPNIHENNFNKIPIFSLSYENKIIKINQNKIALLYFTKLYIFNLNKSLIFRDTKYYKNKYIELNMPSTNNKEIEEILNYQKYINIIPIYFKNSIKEGIKNILTINFSGQLENPDPLLIDTLGLYTYDNIYYLDCYYKENSERFFYILNSEKFNNHTLGINNYLDFYKKNLLNENICNLMKDIKISVELEINNIYLELNNRFKINLTRKDIINLLNNNTYYDLIYSYSKNFILFLLNNTIYQINYDNGQIYTIYELDILEPNDLNYKICEIHYYNKNLEIIEELFLFKHTYSTDKIYIYYWNNYILESIKPFELPDFDYIMEINIFESPKYILKDSLNMERLLVDKESLIIFK